MVSTLVSFIVPFETHHACVRLRWASYTTWHRIWLSPWPLIFTLFKCELQVRLHTWHYVLTFVSLSLQFGIYLFSDSFRQWSDPIMEHLDKTYDTFLLLVVSLFDTVHNWSIGLIARDVGAPTAGGQRLAHRVEMRLSIVVICYMWSRLIVTSLSHALNHSVVHQVFSWACQIGLLELANYTVVALVVNQDVAGKLLNCKILILKHFFAWGLFWIQYNLSRLEVWIG